MGDESFVFGLNVYRHFLCGTQRILRQKVSTKSRMATISLLTLREYCYYLVLNSNIREKGEKMKRENNPIRLGAHLLSHNVLRPTKETESLCACIGTVL